MGSNRNRTAGHNYERELVTRYNTFGFTNEEGELNPLFPVVGTTRSLSVYLDSLKVDITTQDPNEFSDFGLLIQAKNTTNTAQYPKILKQMKEAQGKMGGIPVVYHKQTQRAGTDGSSRFMTRGEYVCMNASDFENIFTRARNLEQTVETIMNYFDSFPEEVQSELNAFLKERNM